jgi:hypothetical protein
MSKFTIGEVFENIQSLQTKLKNKNRNKGFWVIASRSDFRPLKKVTKTNGKKITNSETVVRIQDIRDHLLKGKEKYFIGKKFAFIVFDFNNDFLKLSPEQISKSYSKYSNYIICKLNITIQVINDDGSIGKRNWECIINFTLDDLIHHKLKYSDTEYFMRNTADKLVLSNNMVGIPYKGYKIALEKELKKNNGNKTKK